MMKRRGLPRNATNKPQDASEARQETRPSSPVTIKVCKSKRPSTIRTATPRNGRVMSPTGALRNPSRSGFARRTHPKVITKGSSIPRLPTDRTSEHLCGDQARKIAAGGDHEPAAAGLPFLAGIDGSAGGACLRSRRRIHPGFFRPCFRHVGPSLFSRHRAAAVRAGACLQQVAPREWGGQQPTICRRLHQSDPEARGGGNRETAWRNLAVALDLSDAKQPLLALGGTVYFLPARHADAATA